MSRLSVTAALAHSSAIIQLLKLLVNNLDQHVILFCTISRLLLATLRKKINAIAVVTACFFACYCHCRCCCRLAQHSETLWFAFVIVLSPSSVLPVTPLAGLQCHGGRTKKERLHKMDALSCELTHMHTYQKERCNLMFKMNPPSI